MSNPSERRRSQRVGVVQRASLRLESGRDTAISAQVLDLSEAGLRGVGALGDAAKGDHLTVELRIPRWIGTRKLKLPAVLTRVGGPAALRKREFACEFLAEEETLAPLSRYLDRAKLAQKRLAAAQGPASSLADALRLVRLSLGSPTADSARVVLVSSAIPGEGKSFTAVHLGALLANEGERVLMVDADLRSPSLHDVMGLPAGPGIAELLGEGLSRSVDDVIRRGRGGVSLIAAGSVDASSDEWSSELAARLIEELRATDYDYIVMDSPPLLASATGSMLAATSDDVLLVARSGSTRMRQLEEAKRLLERRGAALCGVVLNDEPEVHEYSSPKPTRDRRGRGGTPESIRQDIPGDGRLASVTNLARAGSDE